MARRPPRARGRPRHEGKRLPPASRLPPAPRPPKAPSLPPRRPADGPPRPPEVGEYLWTTREGAEQDLVDELLLAKVPEPRAFGSALVASRKAPPTGSGGSGAGRIELTFARQGFPVAAVLDPGQEDVDGALLRAFAPALEGASHYALHVWVPDSTEANALSGEARGLLERLDARIAQERPALLRIPGKELGPDRVPLLQVCVASRRRLFAGAMPASRAPSLAPGGRLRAHVGGDRPSRAARKIAEALAWLGVAPEPGELCVDLGAAPGGWTWFLLDRKVRVIAVDPAKLRPDLLARRGLTYVSLSAFEFEPDEPVDWVFCDMAWRPLEVAQMLSRWARQRLATLLVANFKLPMKRKAEMVAQLRATLEQAGWRAVKTRQLYHDREEITLTARLG